MRGALLAVFLVLVASGQTAPPIAIATAGALRCGIRMWAPNRLQLWCYATVNGKSEVIHNLLTAVEPGEYIEQSYSLNADRVLVGIDYTTGTEITWILSANKRETSGKWTVQ